MKKEELHIKLVAELAKLENGRIKIEGIVPITKRVNKRFTSVIARFLKSTGNPDTDGLYFTADETGTVTWKCTNLSVRDMEAVLSEIERQSKRVYIVMYENCEDFTSTSKIEIVTKSYKKAKSRFDKLAEYIRETAGNYGWECDETDTTVEAYEEGYASENHRYLTLYESELT